MTGPEIFERAKRAQAERTGIRAKVRVPSELWYKVRQCASACAVPTEEYVLSVCRAVSSGKINVPIIHTEQIGTRGESETVWVRVPAGFDISAASLRSTLLAGVEYTAERIKPAPEMPVEGVDYLLDGKNYGKGIGVK